MTNYYLLPGYLLDNLKAKDRPYTLQINNLEPKSLNKMESTLSPGDDLKKNESRKWHTDLIVPCCVAWDPFFIDLMASQTPRGSYEQITFLSKVGLNDFLCQSCHLGLGIAQQKGRVSMFLGRCWRPRHRTDKSARGVLTRLARNFFTRNLLTRCDTPNLENGREIANEIRSR